MKTQEADTEIEKKEESKEEERKEEEEEEVEKKKGKRKKLIESNNKNPVLNPNLISKKKTKGAKIIDCLIPAVAYTPAKINNVILHLKCTIQEIDEYIYKSNWKFNQLSYNPTIPTDIIAYDNNQLNKTFGDYIPTSSSPNLIKENLELIEEESNVCIKCQCNNNNNNNNNIGENQTTELTMLSEQEQLKIKQLKILFYKNEMHDKKADCFWCTCPFDNDPCYILQYGYNNDIYGHGSYCSPECAVAFLFSKQQLWDDSAKTESFQLMNYYYGKPNNYQQSIKPALSPYYFLDKYYGNLTIQEYRKLTKSQHMMLIVEKPITRILPEIHEDNDILIVGGNNYTNCGKYKVKKQSEKPAGVSRNTILREKFGLYTK
jgi:hypothetical protein